MNDKKKFNIKDWWKTHPMFILTTLVFLSSTYTMFKPEIEGLFGITRGRKIESMQKQQEIYFHLWLGETEKTALHPGIRKTNHGGLFYFDQKSSKIWGVSHSGEGIGDYMYIDEQGKKVYIK